MNRILIIEDELSMRLGLRFTLEDAGYDVCVAETGEQGMDIISREVFDVIVTDFRLPGYNGIEILEKVKEISPSTCVIVITAFAEIENAVKAIKLGAFDYIQKPLDPSKLIEMIDRFLSGTHKSNKSTCCDAGKQPSSGNFGILGQSRAVGRIFDFISASAKSDSSVMIFGESGTGKELVANAIHLMSKRCDSNIIKINSASIPEELLEAELCGYEKGAFTGAFQQKKGKLELAHEGTFFFDEIGDMPFNMQTKLLRIIENKSFERLGGNKEIYIDTRFVFATRMNISELISAGRFREDLFYRINVLTISLPPLRDRREDILTIAEHYATEFSKKLGKSVPDFSEEFKEFLSGYDFPGNIRELKHLMENIITFCDGGTVFVRNIPSDILNRHDRTVDTVGNSQLDYNIKEIEKSTILDALNRFLWRKSEAAKYLGISRATLWRKMKELGIERA
ncbi:sigma-54-dependent transcriptional regulator [Seleniivibrio woodruffii]|uniref:Fis family sigma54 specific transcriptional regulator n=1 Tax=Seleniivibrio woodruffii TaxID=1078050 RepID=A0A4R1K2X7_9BACT|nr:sigma-54 dependent transcriptional regulator [Seleniivibrio woodruffii]TCK58408.1 Fis family sigma54 specific transcriptional regulator [Seleniivibrio woodruffii]TVZ36781.1 two-component system response regulator AtoC [Seleniivibrio woodruffii]